MRKIVLLMIVFLTLSAPTAFSQKIPELRKSPPKLELGAIVAFTSNMRSASNWGTGLGDFGVGNGYGIRATRNYGRRFALELQTLVTPAFGEDGFQVSVGPKFTFARDVLKRRFNFFFYGHTGAFRDQPSRSGFLREWSPALGLGGGTEFQLSKPLAIRFDMGDYMILHNLQWYKQSHHRDLRLSLMYRFK